MSPIVHERWWLWRLKVLFVAVVGLFFAVGLVRSLFRYFFFFLLFFFIFSPFSFAKNCGILGDCFNGCYTGVLQVAFYTSADMWVDLDDGKCCVTFTDCYGNVRTQTYTCGMQPFSSANMSCCNSVVSTSCSNTVGASCITCSDGNQACGGLACPALCTTCNYGGVDTVVCDWDGVGVGQLCSNYANSVGVAPPVGGNTSITGTPPTVDGLNPYVIDTAASLSPTQSISGDVSAVQGVSPNHSPSVGIVSSPPVVAGVTLPIKSQSSQGSAPQLSAYSNSNYSLCDCRQVLSNFFTDVRKSSLFSLVSFSGLGSSGGGSSSFTFNFGRYGVQTLDFSAHSFAYAIISSILFFLASLLSVRIIILKR